MSHHNTQQLPAAGISIETHAAAMVDRLKVFSYTTAASQSTPHPYLKLTVIQMTSFLRGSIRAAKIMENTSFGVNKRRHNRVEKDVELDGAG